MSTENTTPEIQHLAIPISKDKWCMLPLGITEEDYACINKTLKLWRRRMIAKPQEKPTEEKEKSVNP